jgi:F-type H+-transporting ATPase subunit b
VSIDWFTYVAQLVNFALLVFLLKRFLYGPVLEAVDRRETEIATRLASADEERARATQELQAYETLKSELAEQRTARMKEVEREADELRAELESGIRVDVERSRNDWRKAVRSEREGFVDTLRSQMSGQLNAALRRVLHDLADVDLDSRIVETFLRYLRGLDDVERAELLEAAEDAGDCVVVRTSFPLSEMYQEQLERALAQAVDRDLVVEFETERARIAGIEVAFGERKVGWSVDSYLDSIERQTVELITGETG